MVGHLLTGGGCDTLLITCPPHSGATPLFIAAQNAHLAVLKILIDSGLHVANSPLPAPLFLPSEKQFDRDRATVTGDSFGRGGHLSGERGGVQGLLTGASCSRGA